jgi:predicted amidohydrolase
MKVGFYQSNPVFGKVKQNVEEAVQEISRVNAGLIVLPELFNTGYQFVSRQEVSELAEDIPSGYTCQTMMGLAKDQGMFLVFGLPEKDDNSLYNSAAVVGPKGFIGRYRKIHLFSEEKLFFNPGDTGFGVFDIGAAIIGIMICFDWLFPESARVLALLGADIICHPANLVLPYCQKAMVTRSLENGVFTITANRVGTESRGDFEALTFTGESQILDNVGRVLARLEGNDTGVVLADIDPKLARNKSVTARNERFKDRRPEFYGPLQPCKGGCSP